jgi:uroporphyrinogen-III synthase
MTRLLVLRPQPAAAATVERARSLGMEALAAPIFDVKTLAWAIPARTGLDAVMLTSAHAARLGGAGLRSFIDLPCFAVGDSTAAAARDAGFADVRSGDADVAALVARMSRGGVHNALHPCGREFRPVEAPFEITRRIVYAAEPIALLPARAAEALRGGAIALLHSPRAAEHFAMLVQQAGLDRSAIPIAAISDAAARAAGKGWKEKHAAPMPRDDALLELAAKLCKTARRGDTGRAG